MVCNSRIRMLRNESGYTLKDIAEKLGVTDATAQRYESEHNGIKNIPYDIIFKYSELFDCRPQYLVGWDNDRGHFKDTQSIRLGLSEAGIKVAQAYEKAHEITQLNIRKILDL